MAAELVKILLAEDEPDIREIAALSLELVGGLVVETCESGTDVVEKALSFRPDMIVLDVMMPGMDGPHAYKKLRETPGCEDIPVVFMTAKVMKEEVEQLKAMGARAVIAKPFDPATLPLQIEQIWADIFQARDD